MKHIISDHAIAIKSVTVDGAAGPVDLQVYESGNGLYFAVDGSWLEQCTEDSKAIYIQSPIDDGYSIQLIDSIDEKINSSVSGDCDQILIDRVIAEIKRHISEGDITAIDELLGFIPNHNLEAFLPEP